MWPFNKKQPSEINIPALNSRVSAPFFASEASSLKDALKVAITALENDTFPYDWSKQSSCNCGIVVQAILKTDKHKVVELFSEAQLDVTKNEKEKTTWREVAQSSCSITGIPTKQVFKLLQKHGLSPKDIVHLEYMNNKGILAVSNIDTGNPDYFKNQLNLIKYLKGWLKVIEEEVDTASLTNSASLECQLILAVSKEDYESASKLRDELAKL